MGGRDGQRGPRVWRGACGGRGRPRGASGVERVEGRRASGVALAARLRPRGGGTGGACGGGIAGRAGPGAVEGGAGFSGGILLGKRLREAGSLRSLVQSLVGLQPRQGRFAPPSAVACARWAWPSLTRPKPSRAWDGSRDGQAVGPVARKADDGGSVRAMRAPRAPRGTRPQRGRAGHRRSEAKTRSDGARAARVRAQRRAGAQAQAGRGSTHCVDGVGGGEGQAPFLPPRLARRGPRPGATPPSPPQQPERL